MSKVDVSIIVAWQRFSKLACLVAAGATACLFDATRDVVQTREGLLPMLHWFRESQTYQPVPSCHVFISEDN
ncbi:hypothetical protein T484DRAFT_1771566 [Baffinella frigidus]|nr:hypothetical protein T484DRAFT_1771566 [Cryptophyta sp. CCMP2293]